MRAGVLLHKDAAVGRWEPAGVTDMVLVCVGAGRVCVNIRGSEGWWIRGSEGWWDWGQTRRAEFSIVPGDTSQTEGRVTR